MKKTILVTSLLVLSAIIAPRALAKENESLQGKVAISQSTSISHGEDENEREIEDDGGVGAGIHANPPLSTVAPVATPTPNDASVSGAETTYVDSSVASPSPTATPANQTSLSATVQAFEKLQFGNKAAFEELVQAITSFLREVIGRK